MATIPRSRRNAPRYVSSQQTVAQAFGTITANSQTGSGYSSLAIPLPGIVIGDTVIGVTPSADTVGLDFKGRVTAAGVLTVYCYNITTGNVVLPTTVTLSVAVEKFQ